MTQAEIFQKLYEKDVNGHVEKKNGLNYLSWAWAWSEFKKVCPTARYEVKMFDGLPYIKESGVGHMVFTSITVDADDGTVTHEMFLPVMDNRNKTIFEPTMFDINKTIMRCLTKNIAMFGLGIYIYAGEDLPGEVEKPITEEQIAEIESLGVNVANAIRYYKVKSLSELTEKQAAFVIESKKGSMKNEN